MVKKSYERFWEIDLLRGTAVVMLIVFHFLYDLNYFDIYNISLYSGYFLIYVYFGASLFLLLVGISLSLSFTRAEKVLTKKELQLKYLKRGLKIFGLGLLITLVSWIYLGEGFIVFGSLHCIGISIIFAYPFLHFHYQNLLLGVVFILAGVILKTLTFDFNWLIWLGFKPSQFFTVDYFPLLPWFGVVLIGIFLGNNIYPNYKRIYKLKDLSRLKMIRFACFLGRYSLIIYFIHLPIIFAVIHLFFLL